MVYRTDYIYLIIGLLLGIFIGGWLSLSYSNFWENIDKIDINPTINNSCKDDFSILNSKLNLLKDDINEVLYNYDELTQCRLYNIELKSKLKYQYGDTNY